MQELSLEELLEIYSLLKEITDILESKKEEN